MSHPLTAGIFPIGTLAGGFRAEAWYLWLSPWWLAIDTTPQSEVLIDIFGKRELIIIVMNLKENIDN